MMRWTRYSNPSPRESEEDIDRDVQRIIAEQDQLAREKVEFGRLVWDEFVDKGIVVLPVRPRMPGLRVSLTHSTYPGVKYQVTRWDEEGPFGHRDASSPKSALDEMWEWAGMVGWRERWARRKRVK